MLPSGLRGSLSLYFLCSRTISIVGIHTGWVGMGWVGGYPPWDRMGLMGLGIICFRAWVVLGYWYRYYQYR